MKSTERANRRLIMRIELMEYTKMVKYKLSGTEQNLYFLIDENNQEFSDCFNNYKSLEKLTGHKDKTLQRAFSNLEKINLVTRGFDSQNKIKFITINNLSELLLNLKTTNT
jgi:hypothetical protein